MNIEEWRKSLHLNDASFITGIPVAILRGLVDGSMVAVSKEPTDDMIKTFNAAMKIDRIQGFQYGDVFVVRDVWLNADQQELWRGPTDLRQEGELYSNEVYSIGPCRAEFVERCEIERVRLGLRAMFESFSS